MLYLNGEVERIMPLEDESAFTKANPVTSERTIVFEEAPNDHAKMRLPSTVLMY
jgi:hypothetical protein